MQDMSLTPERLKFFLEYDSETGVFKWRESRGRVKKGDKAGAIDGAGRLLIRLDKYTYKAHRLAWFYMNGAWPEKQIDHIDGDQLNNAWANLREVTGVVNQQNKRKAYKNNKTGLLGVSWSERDKRFVSRINHEGKRKTVGSFLTAEEAHAAYLEAKRRLHEGNTL